MVDILWSMCLLQFYFTLISPSVFGVALYTSLTSLDHDNYKESGMNWTEDRWIDVGAGVHLNAAGALTSLYLLVYTIWVIYSYWAPVRNFIILVSAIYY